MPCPVHWINQLETSCFESVESDSIEGKALKSKASISKLSIKQCDWIKGTSLVDAASLVEAGSVKSDSVERKALQMRLAL